MAYSQDVFAHRVVMVLVTVCIWMGFAFTGRLLGYTNTDCMAVLMLTSVVMVPFLLAYLVIGPGTGEDPNSTYHPVKHHLIKTHAQ
jgi:hypothetical protein